MNKPHNLLCRGSPNFEEPRVLRYLRTRTAVWHVNTNPDLECQAQKPPIIHLEFGGGIFSSFFFPNIFYGALSTKVPRHGKMGAGANASRGGSGGIRSRKEGKFVEKIPRLSSVFVVAFVA